MRPSATRPRWVGRLTPILFLRLSIVVTVALFPLESGVVHVFTDHPGLDEIPAGIEVRLGPLEVGGVQTDAAVAASGEAGRVHIPERTIRRGVALGAADQAADAFIPRDPDPTDGIAGRDGRGVVTHQPAGRLVGRDVSASVTLGNEPAVGPNRLFP